jgi:glycosyltransferase involved in cell wall biosynthesis
MAQRIYFTVTNDLTYDQRMHRICSSLAAAGYSVTLVGRKMPASLPLEKKSFRQVRLNCLFQKGKWFYREYNIRLFFYLLFHKMDAICAIDLDTILPAYYVSKIKGCKRIYDAHELFTELKEVISRPPIHRKWLKIERKIVPKFKQGYTVSEGIAEEFRKRYGLSYAVIRNMPVLKEWLPADQSNFILYQGAVNEARGFEWLIPAMKDVDATLVVCGDGNFMPQLKSMIKEHEVENKVDLRGLVKPAELWTISRQAKIGIAIAEKQGLNQLLALPNKFFDYMHAGLPQVTMNFPEYRKINQQFEVAVLMPEPGRIAQALNNLLQNDVLYSKLRNNCLAARKVYNWQEEEKKLLSFYHSVLNH